MNELTKKEEGLIVIKLFVATNKLNTFKLLNKNTIGPTRIMDLCCIVNFGEF